MIYTVLPAAMLRQESTSLRDNIIICAVDRLLIVINLCPGAMPSFCSNLPCSTAQLIFNSRWQGVPAQHARDSWLRYTAT